MYAREHDFNISQLTSYAWISFDVYVSTVCDVILHRCVLSHRFSMPWSLTLCYLIFLQANCSTNSPSSGSSPSTRSRKPGAIIESFVNHAPGVFSGTFSGERTRSRLKDLLLLEAITLHTVRSSWMPLLWEYASQKIPRTLTHYLLSGLSVCCRHVYVIGMSTVNVIR